MISKQGLKDISDHFSGIEKWHARFFSCLSNLELKSSGERSWMTCDIYLSPQLTDAFGTLNPTTVNSIIDTLSVLLSISTGQNFTLTLSLNSYCVKTVKLGETIKAKIEFTSNYSKFTLFRFQGAVNNEIALLGTHNVMVLEQEFKPKEKL